jgi:DNA repair exonuclease SbcCD ATPase subunit
MSSENLLNEVIVSLMATQKSMKESLKEMSESMKLMKTEMERFKGLNEQVDSLKAENKDLKEKLDTLLKEKQGSIDFDRVPSHALLALTLELLPTLDNRMMNQMVRKTATRTTKMNLMMMGIVIIIYLALIVVF